MPDTFVAEDAARMELVFEDAAGEQVRLGFSSEQFDLFTNHAIQLFTHVRNEKLAIGDHLEIQPVGVVAAAADSTIGGGKVLLHLRADNGVQYHFALDPDEADALRPQLFRASKSAEKQARKSRH